MAKNKKDEFQLEKDGIVTVKDLERKRKMERGAETLTPSTGADANPAIEELKTAIKDLRDRALNRFLANEARIDDLENALGELQEVHNALAEEVAASGRKKKDKKKDEAEGEGAEGEGEGDPK